MNNRNETPYRLQRKGFGEIQVGWERVYDLTPLSLKEIIESQSLIYDKPLSISFPEWWKNDKEAFLPSVILNNIFGIIPDYDNYDDEKNLIGIRLVNLATNEVMETFPGGKTDAHLLFTCKHILTYCKKVLRSWGKETFKEFRYGMEWLRDPWHKENYPDAFQRPDVRIYDVIRYDRLTLKKCLDVAFDGIQDANKGDYFNDYQGKENEIYSAVKGVMLKRMTHYFQDDKPADLEMSAEDLEKAFWYLFDKDFVVSVFLLLVEKTRNSYKGSTYATYVAIALLSGFHHPSV